MDIPTSAQRPCCSAPNLVCDQQHILTVQRACRHFNLTQDTGTWSRKCRVYDVCHEDVSKPLTSDQSVVMTIRPGNAYYMYNVELLGLIERSVMCSSLQYDLGDCFVCRCITGSLMLLSSTTNPQEQGGNSSSDTTEDMCIPAATTDLVYNCPSFSKIKDVPQRGQCVMPGKAIIFLWHDGAINRPSNCSCIRAITALHKLGLWNVVTLPGNLCNTSLERNVDKKGQDQFYLPE